MSGKFWIVAALLPRAALAWNSSGLPVVDLGYQIQRASGFNETGGFYNFSNIRYAAPPVGDLRFAPPEAPAENRSVLHTGLSEGRICPQALPAWNAAATSLVTKLLFGLPINDTAPFTPPAVNWSTPLPPQDPRTSEDCLFLDVFVPEKILNSTGKRGGAPVLVWIYGGGYTAGNKYLNPAGLLAASGNVTDGNIADGEVIYVSFNYRLGALGFLSGPTYQALGGTSNLGFYDQRAALEWVQKYIHLFGGDPERVTIFGESAGGGSIIHQITAYGGQNGSVPFKGAVPQSPGWIPSSSQLQQEDGYQRFLNLTNCTSLEELRALSSEDIIRANFLQIYESEYSTYSYGPTVDGNFVPLQPSQLLAQGRFDKSVRVMVGHNANEGPYFTPPVRTNDEVASTLRHALPYIPEQSLTYIMQTLYPPVFDGKYGYINQFERATLIISEGVFTCNTYFLSEAFDNKTYSYLFSVPPALHGFDLPYTYYEGGDVSSNPLGVTNRTVALALQEFITSFAIEGRPQADGVREFRMYGPDARILDLDVTGIEEVGDPNASARCNWWQKGLYS